MLINILLSVCRPSWYSHASTTRVNSILSIYFSFISYNKTIILISEKVICPLFHDFRHGRWLLFSNQSSNLLLFVNVLLLENAWSNSAQCIDILVYVASFFFRYFIMLLTAHTATKCRKMHNGHTYGFLIQQGLLLIVLSNFIFSVGTKLPRQSANWFPDYIRGMNDVLTIFFSL